jgi:uncharacterized protein with FMN-binding domain
MKKIVYAVLATLSGLVLIFSYRTSLEAVQPMATTDPVASSDTTGVLPSTDDDDSDEDSDEDSDDESDDESEGGTAQSPTSGSTTTSTSTLVDGTYTGGAANTRYGPVQVQISVSGGQIAEVQVLDYPASNSKDRQINERALPILISETTQAQSAQIDMVSGATYTSDGYIASLQSAIDQAQG